MSDNQDASDLGERILKRSQGKSSSNVTKFRTNMVTMGFVQVNLFVPQEGKEEVMLCADKVRAYSMVKLCELPVDDRRRQILADRNFYAVPTYEMIKQLEDYIRSKKLPLMGELKALREHVSLYMTARGALQHATENDEVFKYASLAVAHSAVAKYHNDWIAWNLAQ